MLITGVVAWQVVLAVHILGAVVAFGSLFAYPLVLLTATRRAPHTLPLIHRVRQVVGRWLINPGLTVVLGAGLYMADDLHQFSQFYVQWGLGVVVVIGALEGSVVIRGEGRLAKLAESDLVADGASAGGAPAVAVTWSPEYRRLRARTSLAGIVMAGLVVATIYFMTVQA